MQNTSEVFERMHEVVAYLKGKRIIRFQKDIAETLGMNKVTVSQALKGNESYFTESFVRKFCEAFGINGKWLLTGDGEMLISKREQIANEKDTILIDGHELSFSSIEMAIYKNRSKFTREGSVINLIIKDEVSIMFEKIVKENNLQVKYTVKD